MMSRSLTDLYWLPSQYEESLSSLREEPGELMDEDMLNLVCLLDLNADTGAVDAWLNEDTLVLVPRHY